MSPAGPGADPGDVRDDPEGRRYVLEVEGAEAFIAYRPMADGSRAWLHTEVPAALEGKGVGSALVAGALALARDAGTAVHPYCPFVHAYIRRHPEWADLVGASYPRRGELTG